jgi:hypothetical protein
MCAELQQPDVEAVQLQAGVPTAATVSALALLENGTGCCPKQLCS